MQNSFKRDAIHTVHNTECMQKTRFQLHKPRGGGETEKKRKEKQEEIILEGAPLQYVREYSSPLIRIVGECNAW
jgi:hypothetical protein